MTRRKRKVLTAIAVLAALWSFCFWISPSGTFERVGYQCDTGWRGHKFRVFTYYVKEVDFTKIRNHARNRLWTEGGSTAVYYFSNRIYTPDCTYTDVNSICEDPRSDLFMDKYKKYCVAAYWKNAAGHETFARHPFRDGIPRW